MIIDIAVACIAGAFVLLVIFLIFTILKFNQTSKDIHRLLLTTKKDMDDMSVETVKLIKNLNDTTVDIKKKLHALDPIFQPFEPKHESEGKKLKHYDLATELAEGLSAALVLYNKIRGGIKEYVKSR